MRRRSGSVAQFRGSALLLALAGMFALALVSAGSLPHAEVSAASCGGIDRPCSFGRDNRDRYYLSPPPTWDGRRAIGILLFFHGYRSSGRATVENALIREAAHRGGYMLVAADGLHGTWSFRGSPGQFRDEIDYVERLMVDLARRVHLNEDDMWVSGFSQGGSMAWEVTCLIGARFKAYVPISGAFWQPLPDHCPGGAVNLLHIHGTADRTVPMAGRAIGPFHQGDVKRSLEIMRSSARCGSKPASRDTIGNYSCETWRNCNAEAAFSLCLHPRGHEIPTDWADLAYDFLSSIAAQ
ncbi:MAG: hypothetical protein NW216_06510 [Hyphomicrobium sp.]|nr:hypothetical protein [Hyphomicrobium sp.]